MTEARPDSRPKTCPAVSPTAWYLFSPRMDVAVFLGSALLSMLALAWGAQQGYLHQDSPEWTWVVAVLLVDVAHVWSTGFRVYFDAEEVRRRPHLYIGTPLLAWLIGAILYLRGPGFFWRVLAYLAVWHFVRQQYGWVALYRAKNGDPGGWHRALDTGAIYLATIYPLAYWHSHLPRNFWWFLHEDFATGPAQLASFLAPLYWVVLFAYTLRAVACWCGWGGWGRPSPGKDMVVFTTWFCWYVGIVALNSDFAFTVTNVLIHGIPYMALVYHRARPGRKPMPPWWFFLLTLWAIAYCEELLWDRAVWHERRWLFGVPWDVESWLWALVPLLATPQITHYVLDGFIWKRRENPELFEGSS
jgi:hypothetical protein